MEKAHTAPVFESDSNLTPEMVRRQLGLILACPHFRTSKRCSDFLSFVVDRKLEGRQHELKERDIGAAVFGRAPDYETAADPIVRVKANEVRKRLAQYYGDSGDALHIELPAGGYIPEFRFAEPITPRLSGKRHAAARIVNRWTIAGALASVAIIGFVWLRPGPAEIDQFWEPVVAHPRSALICIGTSDTWTLSRRLRAEIDGIPADAKQPKRLEVWPGEAPHLRNLHVSTGHLEAVLQLAALFNAKGKALELRHGAELTLEDVGNHPVISIGAFSNPWTIRKNAELRYGFEGDSSDENSPLWVQDRQNPQTRWVVKDRFPWKKQTRDYAIISRTFDPVSGHVFMTMGGINTFGSQAACEFATKPRYWKDLARTAPKDALKRNLQIVLETTVVGMTPSPPRVLAIHYW